MKNQLSEKFINESKLREKLAGMPSLKRIKYWEAIVGDAADIFDEAHKDILEEIRSLSLKEFEEQMALALKTGDEQKAILAGYAKGVISRLLSLLEGKQ